VNISSPLRSTRVGNWAVTASNAATAAHGIYHPVTCRQTGLRHRVAFSQLGSADVGNPPRDSSRYRDIRVSVMATLRFPLGRRGQDSEQPGLSTVSFLAGVYAAG